MQNKHQFFLVVGVPTFGEGGGGVKPVGTKFQVLPKFFLQAPLMEGTRHQLAPVYGGSKTVAV